MLVRQCSRLAGPLARQLSDKAPDGSVKDGGGGFAEKGEADENAYFYKLAYEQLEKLKKTDGSEDNKDKDVSKDMEEEKEKTKK